MRIAVGGIHHETNTFSPLRTGVADFAVSRGAEMLSDPLFADLSHDITVIPTLRAAATPNGLVDTRTYEQLKAEVLTALRAALPVDGIYLDLHGAMDVEGVGDGESDLVGAIRECVGTDVLIAASLDLHANTSPSVIEGVDILTAYRTAPHRDQQATRERAVSHLVRCLRDNIRPQPIMIKLPMVLPGEFAVTDREPARSLYAMLSDIDATPGILDASVLIGCGWTDSAYTSVSVIVVAEHDRALAGDQARRLATAVWERRADFGPETPTMTIEDAIARTRDLSGQPVFLSDAGDNITAGGVGDNAYLLEKLLEAGVADVVVAGIADQRAVAACARAGHGSHVTTALGGTLDPQRSTTALITGVVIHLDPPQDPTLAVLRVDGIDIVITADRRSFLTEADFEGAGIDLRSHRIVVVKLGYLFPDLRDVAAHALMVLSPGCTDLRLETLPYQRLRRPIFPLDPVENWQT